jgi:hypothetical protein
MEPHGPQGDVSRFVVPDGRGRDGPGTGALPVLSACPQCDSRLIQPIRIDRFDDGVCRVERRCAECAWRGSDLFGAREVNRFEAADAAATESVAELLHAVEQARMAGEAERFAAALTRGDVLPEDF